jgi:DNA-binding HxlR family transcriptional regulator
VDATADRICAALLNRGLTHSSFRLYCALVMLLNGESHEVTTALSTPELKALVPGVKGKPLSDPSLRDSLRELENEGLIEIAGPRWSKVSVQVRLTEVKARSERAGARLEDVLLAAPGWVRVSR